MSAYKLYVPGDAAAVSLGADRVAKAFADAFAAKGLDVEIVRNGSRGMHWLEPLVEAVTPSGRVGYGPVKAKDVAGLIDAGLFEGGDHALRLGDVERIPFFAQIGRAHV